MAKEPAAYFTNLDNEFVDDIDGRSDFTTDKRTIENGHYILYLNSTHTTGIPTVEIQFSDDDETWYVYTNENYVSAENPTGALTDIPLPESIFGDTWLPRYMRIVYTAAGSNGNVTFYVTSITND